MTALTPEVIAEIEGLLAATTPGEWDFFGDGSVRVPGGSFSNSGGSGKFVCRADDDDDAALIAATHNALPALLAAARRYLWLQTKHDSGDQQMFVYGLHSDDMNAELDRMIEEERDAALSSAREGASDGR